MPMFFTTRVTASLLAVVVCLITFIASLFSNVATHESNQVVKNIMGCYDKTVIIDPGHGAPDGGAVGVNGVVEKNINLAISLKLKDYFQNAGFTVIMTRMDDNAIYDKGSNSIREKKHTDLLNRLKIANSHPNAMFISVHQNICNLSKQRGSIVFYSPNNVDSKILAQFIQSSIKKKIQPQNTMNTMRAHKNLYILYHARIPAVMVECGFLSNSSECKLLQNDVYQNKIASAIFNGALNFYSTLGEHS